jgi:hypothetical protein
MKISPLFSGERVLGHLCIVLPELQPFYGRAIVIITPVDADKRHKQTPVNHHFRSIPASLQGSTWTNLRLGVVLAV